MAVTWRLCCYYIVLQQSDWCGRRIVGMIDHTGANLNACTHKRNVKNNNNRKNAGFYIFFFHKTTTLLLLHTHTHTQKVKNIVRAYLLETLWNDWALVSGRRTT